MRVPETKSVWKMSRSVIEQRRELEHDALLAKEKLAVGMSTEWIDPLLWSKYTGKAAQELYESFSDGELLDMLRNAAAALGRMPSQREIFCVYRFYIRRRFKNWPTALRAAGLKKPKRETEAKA